MAGRHELTDAQFAKLAPLLPPERPATGRPNHDHRRILNGILWRLRTGAPWRDVPARYGKWDTVYSRFRRWQRAGIWARILAALQAEADERGELDWDLHFVDGTVVRAHQHAAGAKKGAPTVNPRTKPSAAARAASRPSSTSGPRAAASR
jgi:transposase